MYVFHGEDTYSIAQKIAHWKREFSKKYGASRIATFDCSNPDFENALLKQHLTARSLFEVKERSFTIIKSALGKEIKKQDAEMLAACIPAIPSHHFVVFDGSRGYDSENNLSRTLIQNTHKERIRLEEFVIPRGAVLLRWIEEEAKRIGASIDRVAAQTLAVRFDISSTMPFGTPDPPYTLWEISNELGKLCAYAGTSLITPALIETITPHRASAHVFNLVDALLQSNQRAALSCAYTLGNTSRDSHGAMVSLVAFLQQQFRSFLLLKSMQETGKDQTECARALAWNPKRVWVVQQKTQLHSLNSLKLFYRRLIFLEQSLKTSSASPLVRVIHTIALWNSPRKIQI